MNDLGVVGASHEMFCTFQYASRVHHSIVGARERGRPVAVLSVPRWVFQDTPTEVKRGSSRDRFPLAFSLISPAS